MQDIVILGAGGGSRSFLWLLETVNDERDVLVFIHEGSLLFTLNGVERELAAGDVVIVAKGMRRRLTAGPEGVRYLTVHRRRGGLQIASRDAAE